MNKLPCLRLPEDWKHQTPVFVAPKRPSGVLAPLMSEETYEADRERSVAQQNEKEAAEVKAF